MYRRRDGLGPAIAEAGAGAAETDPNAKQNDGRQHTEGQADDGAHDGNLSGVGAQNIPVAGWCQRVHIKLRIYDGAECGYQITAALGQSHDTDSGGMQHHAMICAADEQIIDRQTTKCRYAKLCTNSVAVRITF